MTLLLGLFGTSAGAPAGTTYTGSTADTLTATDSVIGALVAVGSAADARPATDAVTGTVVAAAAVAETLSAVDATTGTLATVGALAESLSVTDSQSGSVMAVKVAAESVAAADTQSATSVTGVGRGEALTATEAVSGSAAFATAAIESLAAADAQDATLTPAGVATVADTLTMSDAHDATVIRGQVPSLVPPLMGGGAGTSVRRRRSPRAEPVRASNTVTTPELLAVDDHTDATVIFGVRVDEALQVSAEQSAETQPASMFADAPWSPDDEVAILYAYSLLVH